MPAIHGGADQEVLDALDEEMIENGRFENRSEALEYCLKYTLRVKHNADI